MTTKSEYLKLAIQTLTPIEYKDWFVMCFTVPLLKETTEWNEKPVYGLVTKLDGIYYVNEQRALTLIVDWKKDSPLFSFKDEVVIDNTWLSSVSGKITTTIGRLLVNALCIHPIVGSRVDFINSKMSQPEIESILITKTKNPEDLKDGDITVKEMVECIDRLNFLMSISTFTNIGATKKTITSPPGISEYKKKLIEEYGDRLKDPVVLVEFENKLAAKDAEYLADDPAAKNIFNKKSRVGRAKMFLAYGKTLDFDTTDGSPVVLDSLSDGISTDPEELAKHMNDLRYGSFSRGASTALAGYAYKVLQRSLSGLKISKVPCNTTKGLKRDINDKNYKGLIDRYIKEKGWVLIDTKEKAKSYIGKEVEMRSTMYCLSPNNTVCYACMGESYKNQESGVSNLAAGISSVLLIAFLKMMHGVSTEVVEIDLEDFCS